MRKIISMLLLLGLPLALQAQSTDSTAQQTIDLDLLEVRSTRIASNALQLPYSLGIYSASEGQLTRQQWSLQEYLTEIPGLFSQNANNYAQDLRIAIRGFGARSAFGIRGIKIVVDGIPETTPDGQGQIDNLTLGNLQRIEVIKGPSAAMYGNAAGGILHIQSKTDFEKNFLGGGIGLGSFGHQQYQLDAGIIKNQSQLLLHGTHVQSNGYRAQSRLQSSSIQLHWLQQFSTKGKLNIQANYTNSPVGDDPGGLTLEEINLDRRQARDRNVTFLTGEAIQQFKVGGSYKHELNANQSLRTYAFYNNRGFEGRLPFTNGGWIELARNYAGHGSYYQINSSGAALRNTLQLGYELAIQSDHRRRFENKEGQKGDGTLDQFENFSNGALYVVNHLYFKKWVLTAGLRWDRNKLGLDDQMLSDGDQSSKRNLSAINPSIGVNYNLIKRLHLYASFRTSFETPSLSELSANPSGAAGFNPDLTAQRAYNYEIGLKGLLADRMDFDLTAFYITTQGELQPFELMDFPGRTFYKNGGSTQRLGLETWLRYAISPSITTKLSYAYSNFTFDDYHLATDGKFLPGLPSNTGALSLRYQNASGLQIRIQHRYIGKLYADDLNETGIPAYQLTDCSLGYTLKRNRSAWTPYFGINNIFNQKYFDNIRLNAFGGRHYEPAAGIHIYGGVRWRIE